MQVLGVKLYQGFSLGLYKYYVTYTPACDQQQEVKLGKLAARARSAEESEEDRINEHRMYARMGSMKCEPLSDEDIYMLLK